MGLKISVLFKSCLGQHSVIINLTDPTIKCDDPA